VSAARRSVLQSFTVHVHFIRIEPNSPSNWTKRKSNWITGKYTKCSTSQRERYRTVPNLWPMGYDPSAILSSIHYPVSYPILSYPILSYPAIHARCLVGSSHADTDKYRSRDESREEREGEREKSTSSNLIYITF